MLKFGIISFFLEAGGRGRTRDLDSCGEVWTEASLEDRDPVRLESTADEKNVSQEIK